MSRLVELGFPFILLEPSDDPRMLTVTADDRDGARRLTEHLIAQGHQRIAFLTTKVPWPMLEQRMLGYCDALPEPGLKPMIASPAARGPPPRAPSRLSASCPASGHRLR